MARIMTLPKIGVNMTEATVVRWLVSVGDTIKKDEPVLEAETDKSTQEIYATEEGIVAKLFVDEGDTVPCHDRLIAFVDEGEEYTEEEEQPAPRAAEQSVESEKKVAPEAISDAPKSPQKFADGRVRISPLARKMAKELGISLERLSPAVPGGRIVKADVLAYTPTAQGDEPEIKEVISMSRLRKITAERMSESYFGRPVVPLTTSADATAILDLRRRYKEKGIKLSFDAIMAKIAAKALREHPIINAELRDDEIVVYNKVNVGVAVDTEKGLLVPVVKNADRKSLTEIGDNLAELNGKAQEGRLGLDDMSGATFTLTNLGMFGIEHFAPIINVPNCCILSIGAFKDCFVPDETGAPVLKKRFSMTLVFDHRIVDGAPASKFLQCVKEYVEFPSLML